jgi:hypothetical protein
MSIQKVGRLVHYTLQAKGEEAGMVKTSKLPHWLEQPVLDKIREWGAANPQVSLPDSLTVSNGRKSPVITEMDRTALEAARLKRERKAQKKAAQNPGLSGGA